MKRGRGTVFQDLDDIYATPLNTGDGTNIHTLQVTIGNS
jgi:hypothetical protein